MTIRVTTSNDIPDLQQVLEETQLFPGDLLPDMIGAFLRNDGKEEVWLTVSAGDGRAIGFCYAAPEHLTDGTWNMLAIAVHPVFQGKGIGIALVEALITTLRDRGQRVLIADTSGKESFEGTRAFYRRNGFIEEARIRDFWSAGDDKVTFWLHL